LSEAISGGLEDILFPYTIAYLTTAIGFLSLLSSPMQPVRDLGLYAGIGIGLGFLSNLVLIPGSLKLFEKATFRRRISRQESSQGLLPVIDRIRRWKWAIAFLGIVLLILPTFLFSS
jgi:predicted RND superfamily exporter protein